MQEKESGCFFLNTVYNKRLRSRYCIVEATDRHEASRGLSGTAKLLVLQRSVGAMLTSLRWYITKSTYLRT